VIERVGETNLTGIETAEWSWPIMEPGSDVSAVVSALDRTGIEVVGNHVGIEKLESNIKRAVEINRAMECSRFVTGLFQDENFASQSAIRDSAMRLARLSERLENYDMDLLYHNHVHEFTEVEGRPGIEILAEEVGNAMEFALDVAWVALSEVDPVPFLRGFDGETPVVHIKDVDYGTETDVELGRGDLDVQGCVDAALENGADWLLYEFDEPPDPEASLEIGAEKLTQLTGSR